MDHVPASQLIGVLMTGMGNDGAEAMADLRARGGKTIAEAEETAVVWGMPGELVKPDGADWVVPLPKIAVTPAADGADTCRSSVNRPIAPPAPEPRIRPR